ncbi:hypothetical protein AB0J82_23185 [Asanoa sp. NPDC049518]|uniref:hypothetical protein n=1 Tax=unclassified Asanoa TaxID=2685164 RepID=UPI00343F0F0C
MSTRIRKALADLEHDTSSLRLAPPARVRARGEAWRRHRVTGGVAAAVAGTITATIVGVTTVGGGSTTSPPPVGTRPTVTSPAVAAETDCGRHALRLFEKLPDSAIACFLDAVMAKRPARLAETRPTPEGAPIHMLYVTDTTGAVRVTTDSRQDNLGNQAVTHKTCARTVVNHGYIEFSQCS